jgi:hypothetical protein
MLTPEREKEIRFYAEQFHHNSSAIDDCESERAIQELLAEIDRLRAENDDLRNTRCVIKLMRAEANLAVAVEALEKISKPTYGTELCNSEEENNSILAPWALAYQMLSREALSKIRGEE